MRQINWKAASQRRVIGQVQETNNNGGNNNSTSLQLTLWLQLANKSTQKTCLLGTDGRQIGPLDSTIVARMADKSAELTVHAKHQWPINRPQDYQLGLVHKSGN